jgi:hypothetical protein
MKKTKTLSRREFVKQNSLAGIGAAVALGTGPVIFANCSADTGTPAILGGAKIRTKPWPSWPVWDQATDEELVLKTLRSGIWSRAATVNEFEKKWAETIAQRDSWLSLRTNALITALVQAGREG